MFEYDDETQKLLRSLRKKPICPDGVGEPVSYGVPEVERLIAHRDPMRFVDAITHIDLPGRRIVGTRALHASDPIFAGHFPGRPTLPGVLMCEAIAQVGAAAVLADERFAGKLPLFGGMDRARFRRQVLPGDELILEVELGRMSARAGKGSGRARVGDEIACQCDLLFVLADA